MSPSPPPVVHVGMKSKSPPTAAATNETLSSKNHAATNTANGADGGGTTLQGKKFVEKIYKLLDVPNYSSIISWNDDGTVVIIHDVDAFISTVMPVYFQRSKFGSFIRRMRRWGFSVTKRRSSSSLLDGEQSTAIEFHSEHFLRDKPNLCLLMKDERQVKKKFSFLDRNVKKVDASGVKNRNQGSSVGVCVHYPSSSLAEGGTRMPSSKNEQPTPVHYPPSLSYPPSLPPMNNANNLPKSYFEVSSPMLKSPSNGDLNVANDDGYLCNHYSQETLLPPLSPVNQFSVHSPMPMMNMVMSPLPPFHCPPYGYRPPPPPPGFGFEPAPSAFQYPAPDGYQFYPQQQQKQQQQMMQQNQQYPPPPHIYPEILPAVPGKKEAATHAAASSTPNGKADVKASTTASASAGAAVLLSSSEETTDFNLLPTTQMHPNAPIQPQFDTERNWV